MAEKNIDRHAEMKVPAEVWRVSNGTGVESYHGGRLVVEKVSCNAPRTGRRDAERVKCRSLRMMAPRSR